MQVSSADLLTYISTSRLNFHNKNFLFIQNKNKNRFLINKVLVSDIETETSLNTLAFILHDSR